MINRPALAVKNEKGEEYTVEFIYSQLSALHPRKEVACILRKNKGEVTDTLAKSVVSLDSRDIYSRLKGRRKALNKALIQIWPKVIVKNDPECGVLFKLQPPEYRANRILIWNEYKRVCSDFKD